MYSISHLIISITHEIMTLVIFISRNVNELFHGPYYILSFYDNNQLGQGAKFYIYIN
jgi:hypothetical protein